MGTLRVVPLLRDLVEGVVAGRVEEGSALRAAQAGGADGMDVAFGERIEFEADAFLVGSHG